MEVELTASVDAGPLYLADSDTTSVYSVDSEYINRLLHRTTTTTDDDSTNSDHTAPTPPQSQSQPQPPRRKRKRRSPRSAAAPTQEPSVSQSIGTQTAPPTPAAAPPLRPLVSSSGTQTPPPLTKEQLFTLPDVMELLRQLDAAHRDNRERERRGEGNLEDPLTKIIVGSLWGRLPQRESSSP